LLFSLACSTLLPTRLPATFTPAPTSTAVPSGTATPQPSSTPEPEPTSTPAAPRSGLQPGDVGLQPGPPLYSGDIVSLEIHAGKVDPDWKDARLSVHVNTLVSDPIAQGAFGSFGIGARAQATFWWAWDTAGLSGPQNLIIVVEPRAGQEGRPAPLDVLTVTVDLLPAEARPEPEASARWAQTESECCLFHYLTHTAAERDIELLKAEADAAFERVEDLLGVRRTAKLPFTLLSRLLGHGGFAASEITLTYIDRNAAGIDLPTVFAHEGVHLLDQQLARTKPAMLTEGLAVFVAGGHYKTEDLERRARALLELNRFIPLSALAKDFYQSQHEIGYLEAGALVRYLVETYGWEAFRNFYGSFQPAPDEARMLEGALAAHFGKGLDEIEADWLAHLRALPVDQAQVDDLRLTIELFDTLRRYQQLNDPSAYFLTAWLPDGPEARRRGIVADFIRAPRAPENIALEAMLAAAEQALHRQDFARAGQLLASVQAVLDARNLFFDPLAADYLKIVTQLSADGYEAQTIEIADGTASVTAIRQWPTLEALVLQRTERGWRLASAPTDAIMALVAADDGGR
jgi:hypothetical protein